MMIVFTHHAVLKLAQRNISKNLVIQTVRQPDQLTPTYRNRIAAFKRFGRRYLKVIFRKEGARGIIITQYWVDRLRA